MIVVVKDVRNLAPNRYDCVVKDVRNLAPNIYDCNSERCEKPCT